MPISTPRFVLIGLCLAAAGLTVGEAARAQTMAACAVVRSDACIDAIDARLMEIARAEADPVDRFWAQLQRALALLQSGRADAAEAVLGAIDVPPEQPEMRDEAIRIFIRDLGPESQTRGRRLLSKIQSLDEYDAARADHIRNLIEHAGFDAALGEVAATDRDQTLDTNLLYSLAVAAVEAGRTETALKLIADHAPNDPDRSSLISQLVKALAGAGKLDEADATLAGITDLYWRSIAQVELASIIAAQDRARAESLFAAAREDLAAIADAERRLAAGQGFVEVAVKAGLFDLALAAVPDIGTFPTDVVSLLGHFLRALPPEAPETTWRPVAEQAIALLADSPPGDGSAADMRDQSWAELGMAIAVVGDLELAQAALARITEAASRDQQTLEVVAVLIYRGMLDRALALAAAVPTPDVQAQMLIEVGAAAQQAGETDLLDQATARLLALVDGKDADRVSSNTIRLVANYEASIGRFAAAEARLSDLRDPEAQVSGRITNLGFVARLGTEADYAAALSYTQATLSALPNGDASRFLMIHMAGELVRAGRPEDALSVAKAITDPEERDHVLSSLAAALGGTHLMLAIDALGQVGNDDLRRGIEGVVLAQAVQIAFVD